MNDKCEEIRKKIKKALDRERYQHTLGVAYTAACLAMRYGSDIEQAYLAGLLHDCAKCIPTEEKFRLCDKHGIELSSFERENPALIHAKLGVYIAEKEYKISNKEILSAIRTHTTGEPDMSLLQKIIFTADFIEPRRDQAKNLTQIRELAFTDLDKAVEKILSDTLNYLGKKKDSPIDPATRLTYEYYSKEHKE